jgi:hypothetical protein
MTGSSTQGIKTVLHPVSDLAPAKAVYAALLGDGLVVGRPTLGVVTKWVAAAPAEA